jgi:hypothetical protein
MAQSYGWVGGRNLGSETATARPTVLDNFMGVSFAARAARRNGFNHPDRSVGANHSNGAFHGIFSFGPLGSGPSSRVRCDAHGMTGKD